MIDRRLIGTIRKSLARYPVVGLIGCRQVGKTTLSKIITEELTLSGAFRPRLERSGLCAVEWVKSFSHRLILPFLPSKVTLIADKLASAKFWGQIFTGLPRIQIFKIEFSERTPWV